MRIEINDIIANIKFKPRLLNIFVEGSSDENILKEFLNKKGNLKQVAVRRIDLVSIDSTIIEKFNLRTNCNKDKVIALAKCVADSGVSNTSTIFIIDKDVDEYISVNHSILENVHYTDFPCIESYIFTKENIHSFFNLTNFQAKGSIQNAYNSFKEILKYLFAFRIEHEITRYCLDKLEYKPRCKFNNDDFVFDFDNYILDRLKTKSLQSKLVPFKQSIDTRFSSLNEEIRHYIHGHDLEQIFYLYIFNNGHRRISLEEFQSNLRLFFINSDQLSQYPLFKRINSFAN